MLNVQQDLTPSMMHHCRGRCDRTHRTLADRLTPFVLDDKQWEEMLPGIVFSINCCVNPGSKYSAFEIIYGKRPNFLLSPSYIVEFKDIPKDTHSYIQNCVSCLTVIREQVKANTLVAQQKMETIENENMHELKLSVGNYVYLTREPGGQGRKCQHTFDGPFVVNNIPSSHIVLLRVPN